MALNRVRLTQVDETAGNKRSYEERDVAHAKELLDEADHKEMVAEANLARFKAINGVKQTGAFKYFICRFTVRP